MSLSLSDGLQVGQTIVTISTVVLGALYVRGKMDGSSGSSNISLDGDVKKLWESFKDVAAKFGIISERITRAETTIEMHGEECDKRYEDIQRTQEKIVESLEVLKNRVDTKFDNLSGQLNNLANDRAGKAYELFKPHRESDERS